MGSCLNKVCFISLWRRLVTRQQLLELILDHIRAELGDEVANQIIENLG